MDNELTAQLLPKPKGPPAIFNLYPPTAQPYRDLNFNVNAFTRPETPAVVKAMFDEALRLIDELDGKPQPATR